MADRFLHSLPKMNLSSFPYTEQSIFGNASCGLPTWRPWSTATLSSIGAGFGNLPRRLALSVWSTSLCCLPSGCCVFPFPGPMKRGVESDAACAKIVRKIESWLPYAGNEPPRLTQRALFRFRMLGQVLAGVRYLTRLSLSTTEDDWSDDSQSANGSLRELLRRPFRLAKKYRRDSKESRER